MTKTRRIVIDVLKPHKPDALEFSTELARLGKDYRVKLVVTGVDKKTESTIITIDSDDVDFYAVKNTIHQMGASVHSIDEVEVIGSDNE
jgi:hypothetical protein